MGKLIATTQAITAGVWVFGGGVETRRRASRPARNAPREIAL
jgi:hypothetical protein